MATLENKNVYVGNRYVPKIFGEWNNQNSYEGLSIVTYQGASYTSKQAVPIGIDILNEDFWILTGNYNAQVEQYRQDVRNLENDIVKFNNLNDEVIEARNGEVTLTERLNKDAEILSSITTVPEIGLLDNNTGVINGSLESKTEIKLKGGEFTLTDPIVIDGSKDVVISGQGVDKTILNFEKTMFEITNTLKVEKTFTTPLTVGDYTVYLNDVNGIEVGDLISIKTSERMEETSRSQIKNHTSLVKKVLTNGIEIENPVPNNFNLEGLPRLLVYNNSGKVIIKDMTLNTDYAGGIVGLYAIDVLGIANPEFRNLKIVNTHGGYQGLTSDGGQISIIRFSETLYPIVDNVEFDSVHYCIMPTSGTLGTKVTNSKARNSRHLVAPTGGAQKTKVIDCDTFDCYAGFDSHQTAYDTDHINCNSYGNEIENKFRGRTDYIENCYFGGGFIVDNDPALSSELDNLLPIKKTITNTIINKYFSALTSVFLHIDNVEVLGDFYIQGVKEGYNLLNSKIDAGETGTIVVWPRGKRVKIDNVEFYGKTKGLSKQSEKITDSGNCIEFNLASSQSFDSIEMTNIEIDGFSKAFSFPTSFNAANKNMVISKILVKNTSTVLDTVANYKDFLVLENISYYDCFEFSNDLARFRFPIISKTLDNITVQGNAIPTIGTWKVGDKVVSSLGTGSEWVCTVAGTPGSWVAL